MTGSYRSLHLTASFAILWLATSTATGCAGKKDPTPDPAPGPQAPSLEAVTPKPWMAKYTATCPDKTPEKCVGHFGFTVLSDGSYEVGPSPTGDLLTGALEDSELKTLQSRAEDARELQQELKILADKYYPPAFPTPCISAALTLEKSYRELTPCEHDSECTYVDENYLPTDETGIQPIPLDDCTYAKPLVVANAFEAVASQVKLLLKKELVQQICGAGLKRSSCSQPTYLKPAQPPRCISGVCTANIGKGI